VKGPSICGRNSAENLPDFPKKVVWVIWGCFHIGAT